MRLRQKYDSRICRFSFQMSTTEMIHSLNASHCQSQVNVPFRCVSADGRCEVRRN